MTKYDQIRKVVAKIMEDSEKHHIQEIREECKKIGIDLNPERNAISNVLFSMKKEGVLDSGEEKGVYWKAEKLKKDVQDSQPGEPEKKGQKIKKAQKEKKIEKELFSDINRVNTGQKKAQDTSSDLDRELKLDWEKFFVLKPQNRRNQEKRITITKEGELRLNSMLQKEIQSRKIEIIMSRDCRTILLNPQGKNAHDFTKAGTIKNTDLTELLSRLKLAFPVFYKVTWDQEMKLWKGELDIPDKK
ncbi:hypothetical protein [Cuneatibacter caecimuris]|uniref:Uncharacterized protein n=1 Tax=Cuneatibacter caecimuris TaxID=1796618 RepID=A0A4Q7P2X8_9FIRM|nr:hypothetical protein [Cuneatibacter caecimuris]RZS94144.1 hypothetical protein EV209_2512 [Cuneatibacter caecimuris]